MRRRADRPREGARPAATPAPGPRCCRVTARIPAAPDAAFPELDAALARAWQEAAGLDADGAFPAAAIADLAAAGLLTAPLPRAEGGQDLGLGAAGAAALCRVLQAVGAASLPLGRLYEGHVNALGLVLAYGDAAARRQAAAAARDGALFGVWNTDDAAAPLRLQDGALTGRKILASGIGHVARPLVTVPTPQGPQMLLLRLAPGARADLSAWQAQGMRASATGAALLEGLPATEIQPIGAPGDYLREPLFSGGAWRFLAVQTGGIATLFALYRDGLRARDRTGDPHQRARIGQAATALETARLWVAQAAARAAGPEPAAAITAYVNLARGAVEQAALTVLQAAQRGIGLQAFLRPDPLERIARDLATYLRQPAPDRALDLAAGFLLEREDWPWP